MANKNCCICQLPIEKEDAPIIAMSGYGNPKCVCSDCENLIEKATLSHIPEEINEACKELGKALTYGNTGDEQVIESVNEIIKDAKKRHDAIQSGSYDFSLDEERDEDSFEITEDLMETEEDRLKDERDERINKLIDTIGSWAAGGFLVGAIVFFIIKFLF